MVIRTQKGIGDAVYCFPIVKHFVARRPVKIITKYPIIYHTLNVETTTEYKTPFDLAPKYTRDSDLNQYNEIIQQAKTPRYPLRLDWRLDYTREFKEKYGDLIRGRKLCIIKEPCAANMHKRIKDLCVAPPVNVMQDFIDTRIEYFFVSVGLDEVFKARLNNINLDLTDKIGIQDLITLCKSADFIVSQVGHLIVLAQAFDVGYKVFYPEMVTDRNKYITKNKIE